MAFSNAMRLVVRCITPTKVKTSMSTSEKPTLRCDSSRAHQAVDAFKENVADGARFAYVRALGLCMVGDAFTAFADQLKALATRIEALPAENNEPFEVELTVPEPAFNAFGDFYVAGNGAVTTAKTGNKVRELLDTYRLYIKVDVAALADRGKFVAETRAIADSMTGEAGRFFDEVHTQCGNVRRVNAEAARLEACRRGKRGDNDRDDGFSEPRFIE